MKALLYFWGKIRKLSKIVVDGFDDEFDSNRLHLRLQGPL